MNLKALNHTVVLRVDLTSVKSITYIHRHTHEHTHRGTISTLSYNSSEMNNYSKLN